MKKLSFQKNLHELELCVCCILLASDQTNIVAIAIAFTNGVQMSVGINVVVLIPVCLVHLFGVRWRLRWFVFTLGAAAILLLKIQ